MASIHVDDKVKDLIIKSYPQAQDAGDDPHKLSITAFPHVEYTQPEKAEIEQWLITSSHIASATEDPAKTAERLSSLNTHLSTRTTLLGSKPSIADVGMYARMAPIVKLWSPEERTGEQGYHHIVRHLDFVQNSPMFSLAVAQDEKIPVDVDSIIAPVKTFDAKAEKEKKKKEKAAAAGGAAAAAPAAASVAAEEKPAEDKSAKEKVKEAAEKVAEKVPGGDKIPGVKKEKKEKKPKQPKPAPVEKPLSPAMIDLRVGHILKAERHPNADSLYVSTINCGDAPGTENTSEYEGKIVRTVCSGLNGLIPLEEMQDRKVVTVCNLKPVTMRGIKSCAMVLAASPRLAPGVEDNHAGPVELVNPPVAAEAGDRVFFEGFEGEPEPVLNPNADSYGQAASNLVAGSNLEQTIQQIMDMGGGSWDRDTVSRALRAAYNNPERAVDYLYSGIPETAEVAVPAAGQTTETGGVTAGAVSGAPNSSPLNMFPQETLSGAGAGAGAGTLDFLRNNPQFQALRSMVQSNPQILQPVLQELGKQNPNLLRLIDEHHAEFLQLINEPVEGSEGDIFDQPEQDMPHAINVTPAEQEAIGRLEAMGFDRASVIEAFLACDRDEQLAANYLLENAGDFED